MESEVDLDEEIKKLQALATRPDLFSEFISLNAVPSLLSLLTHENVDIVIDVVDLINELINSDDEAKLEDVTTLINAMVKKENKPSHSHNFCKKNLFSLNIQQLSNDLLPLIYQTLTRLDETQAEEYKAIYDCLSIIENLIEVVPQVADKMPEQTEIVKFLLEKISKKNYPKTYLINFNINSIPCNSTKIFRFGGRITTAQMQSAMLAFFF